MAAVLILGHQQLIPHLLLQFRYMGDNPHQPGTAGHLLQHFHRLAPGPFVQGSKAFVQERYSFPDGDRQRGRNQLAVVEAVIRKALSPSILSGYLDILESVESCIDTSVPYDLVADLVRWQLSENPQWEIESYSVNGSDAHSTTYSMNQSLYVMIPDESTVQEAQDKLASVAEVIPE